MTFSRRTAQHDETNALTRAAAARADLLDLTVSNPTTAGLPYDPELLRALAAPGALAYRPHALGLPEARAAVSADYRARGFEVPAERIAITASTSEAYAVLFKLLCDPGDEVLVPAPSYPLLGWLAAFEGVTLRTYPLSYAGTWHVDLDALARANTPRTRAIVVVNPNNPTGSYLRPHELEAMLDLGLPIVSDEVFATYPFDDRPRVTTVATARRGLVFALSGLSKAVGLPQLKLGWIAVGGAAHADAMDRLETVLDAYLSVAAPVQHALPELLARGAVTAEAIRARTRTNLRVLREHAPSCSTVLDVEGGWYATLRVPAITTDEAWAVGLVEEAGVFVHPGYFFDMSGTHLVASLLTPEATFAEGILRLAAHVDRVTAG